MARLWVRHTPSSASVVRRSVQRALCQAGVGADESYEATLIASELVGNAIRHAPPLPSGHLAVEWQVADDACVISVTDGGPAGHLSAGRVTGTATTGRGLAIIAAMAEEWGVSGDSRATTVWVRYRFRSQSHRVLTAC